MGEILGQWTGEPDKGPVIYGGGIGARYRSRCVRGAGEGEGGLFLVLERSHFLNTRVTKRE